MKARISSRQASCSGVKSYRMAMLLAAFSRGAQARASAFSTRWRRAPADREPSPTGAARAPHAVRDAPPAIDPPAAPCYSRPLTHAARESFRVHVTKDYLKFSAAHFIAYPGFRERLHGHNYRVSIALDGQLGPQGYVVDFGVVKRIARRLCERLDEHLLIPARSDCLDDPRRGRRACTCATSRTSSAFRAATCCCCRSSTPRSRSWPSTWPASCAASSTPRASARSTPSRSAVEESFGQRAIFRREG